VKDVVSGKMKLFALPDRSGVTVARILLHHVLLEGHTPAEIQCDNAKEFVAGMVRAVNDMLGVATANGTPWTPSVNGAVERSNHTIARLLQGMCNSVGDDWDLKLPFVQHAMNVSVFATTGVSPLFYETGFDAVGPFDSQFTAPPQQDAKLFTTWRDDLNLARAWAQQHREDQRTYMAQYYDARRPSQDFAVGDKVWVNFPSGGKLAIKNHGPYFIKRFLSQGGRVAVLGPDMSNSSSNEITMHVQRLFYAQDRDDSLELDESWKRWLVQRDNGPDPEPIVDAGEVEDLDADEYEIDRIISHKDAVVTRGKGKRKRQVSERQYLVHFKGYDDSENRWCSEDELLDTASVLLDNYLATSGAEAGQAGVVTKSGRKVKASAGGRSSR